MVLTEIRLEMSTARHAERYAHVVAGYPTKAKRNIGRHASTTISASVPDNRPEKVQLT